jgi:hypothetical protein
MDLRHQCVCTSFHAMLRSHARSYVKSKGFGTLPKFTGIDTGVNAGISVMTLSENALKLTGVHLYFENFSKVYRHKYRRQCADFCLKNALKLTGVHLYFENFSGGTAPGAPSGRGYTPSRTLPLNPPTLKPLASPLILRRVTDVLAGVSCRASVH